MQCSPPVFFYYASYSIYKYNNVKDRFVVANFGVIEVAYKVITIKEYCNYVSFNNLQFT